MGKPHKHAELIKAWADGAEIEIKVGDVWMESRHPTWQENNEYRIKHKPKDDYVVIGRFTSEYYPREFNIFALPKIKMTFDGETRQPKSVEFLS